MNMVFEDNINIVIAGEAGQGIETAAEIAVKLLHANNFNVFSINEYMSRIRGGTNSALIKVTKGISPCFSSKINVLFSLDFKALEHLKKRINGTTIKYELEKKNFYVIGYICALFNINQETALQFIENNYRQLFQENNISDFKEGYSDGEKNSEIQIKIPAERKPECKMLLSGNNALGLGCIAGGCNFVPFYPMSPSTFLQAFLVDNSDKFSILTKQVEDEICVINMALGAWYAGARAIACTSGGGFALMCEGVSLAGMTETPVVINIAQRPGPATGLPTRTEQGDLNLALYSGHGEFPRIIYAPATIDDAFLVGQSAFNMADKFQIPVFILTDQALLDSVYSCKEISLCSKNENYFVKSAQDYKRYKLSENLVSERSIPNYGKGVVCVDSDEHDESGYITEDFSVREKMVQKRLKKLDLIEKEILEPYFIGGNAYKTLIISWGSNFNVIKKAIKSKKEFIQNIAFLHFVQVYPVHKILFDYAQKAQKVVIIEQNATGEFENLIKRDLGLECDDRLRKYNGMPFSIEEIQDFLEKINEV